MKKVLFISATNYDFKERSLSHLEEKFLGLSKGIKVFVLAKGKPFHIKKWNTEFYLFPSSLLLWPVFLIFGFWICLTKKINTIIAQSPLTEGLTGSIIKTFLKKELIVEIHGDWIEGPFLSKKRKFKSLLKKIIPVLAKISLRKADKVRAISKFTKNQALKISGQKPYFLFPTFTDIDIFLAEKDIFSENFILFVGFLSAVKNVDTLIDAFAKIKKEFPSFKLVIVGEGLIKKDLQLKVKNLSLDKEIEFKGRLSLKNTKEIMKRCYCLVLPSFSEGLGRVLMEAMALGKPVIGSNVVGIPDLIKDGENGFLFDPKNAQQLTEKLIVLLRNKELAVKMGKEGKRFIENNFSNQKYINNYISMINA